MSTRKRVLIVGARFGEAYLNAFLRGRPGLELAGLLSRGSARARQLTQAFAIPLYTSMEQVPDDIDIACVVVRSTIVGGMGTSIAEALLTRGIHVIQEHPVHPDEVQRLQQKAAEQGVNYWVNSFYSHTECGRCWAGAAADIRHQLHGEPPTLVQLTTSRQLLYSSLDLIVRAGGWLPQDIVVRPDVQVQGEVFTDLQLQASGTAIALRLQATMDPGEPDQHSQVMHHCDFIWPSGYLSLAATYGPVNWTPALYMPGHHDEQHSLYRQPDASSGLGTETHRMLYPAAVNWQEAMEVHGPAGVAWLLEQMVARIDGHGEQAAGVGSSAYQWGLAALWQQVLRNAGPVKEQRLQPPRRIEPFRASESALQALE